MVPAASRAQRGAWGGGATTVSETIRGLVKPKTDGMSTAGCIALLVLYPVGFALWAYTRVTLWAWFIVPFGLPPLTIPWSIGLGCVIAAFTVRIPPATVPDKKPDDAVTRMFTFAVASPLGVLVCGWACTWFLAR